MPQQPNAIPLEKRRCTKCGRGVGDGARFTKLKPKQPGWRSYRNTCTDCETARLREWRAERRRILATP